MIKPVCPRDRTALERRPTEGITRFQCPSCLGFAVNMGALRRIFPAAEMTYLMRDIQRAPKGTMPCSHCRQTMNVLVAPMGVSQPELDHCPRCQLLWLDTGEWDEIGGRKRAVESRRDESQTLMRTYAATLLEMERARSENQIGPVGSADHVAPGRLMLAMIGLPTEEENEGLFNRPLATWTVIAACVLVSALAFQIPEYATAHLAFRAGPPWIQNLFRAFSSFFVHATPLHLLANMYFLWIFGDDVEDHVGPRRYLGLIATATLASCLAYAALDPHAADRPLVGASGGVAGLIAFYLVCFPHRRFVLFFPHVRHGRAAIFAPITISGTLFAAMFFGKELIGAWAQVSSTTPVSHLSHLGGALVGLAIGLTYRRR